MQVVGHTPVKKPLETKVYNDYILTLDTFSTYSGGDPIGDQRFVWIDTEKQMWEYAD